MKTKLILALFKTTLPLLLCFLSTNVFAQKTIKGTVSDDSGEVLTGVSIIIKGTTTGTVSDINGAYSIASKATEPTLVFSYLGYATKEIEVGNKENIHVVLSVDTKILNEVVVSVGYGGIKRKDLTGSVSSVKTVDIQKAPVSSFEQALGGRIAGVQVTSSEGTPGGGMDIVIRGKSSITQDNSPLYVIDGFPMEDFDANTLNPSDIESIDILKDASATAIYGARGANGVIIVNTKKGKEGRPLVSFDAYWGFQTPTNKMETMNAADFVKLQLEIDSYLGTSMYLRDPETGEATLTPEDYRGVKLIDWQDKIMQTALIQSYTTALSGGTKATKYNMSLNYFNQDGVIIESGYDRYQGRLRLDQEVNDKVKAGLNINYSQAKQYGTNVRYTESSSDPSLGLMYNMWGYRPVAGSGNLDDLLNNPEDTEISDLGSYGNRFNPLLYINNETRETYQKSSVFNAFVEYQIDKYLKLRVTGAYNSNSFRYETFFNSQHPNSKKVGGTIKGVNGSVLYDERESLLNENTLSYYRNFNRKHSFYAVAGVTAQKYSQTRFGGTAWNVPRESLGISGLDEGDAQPLTSSKTKNTLLSALTRINYNYLSRYYATFSFRADGSSKFPTDNKWSYFPSGALSWRLGQEDFIKNIDFISDAKLRASYGETGNNRVADLAYLSQLQLNTLYGYSQNNEFTQGAVFSNLGNDKQQWETTKSTDLGIDLSFFNERISLTADWYLKKTNNLLLNADLPLSSGYSRSILNIGSVQNSGFELTLNTVNIDNRNFTWSSDFNISWNRNKLLSLADGEKQLLTAARGFSQYGDVPLYIAEVGKPIAQFYGMLWDGVYQISDFNWQNDNDPSIPHEERDYVLKEGITDNGLSKNQIKPGYIKYKDISEDKDGHIDNNDRTVIGDPNPDFTGGFSNNFSYKGFDLNIFFQFSVGGDVANANRLLFEGTYRFGLNQYASYADRWSPENPTSKNYVAKGGGNNYYSDRIIEDGSYLKLKTVQLAYNFPTHWTNKAGISKLRLYCSAQNLLTFSKYSGWDPEVSVNNSALTPNFDYSAYPRARAITLGLNATF